MQVIDEQKRSNILKAAADLFATLPFHKVLLDDVAKQAGVGKGTLYVYFKNKEDLYFSVLYEGFSNLVERIRHQVEDSQLSPIVHIERAIREIVEFAFRDRTLFEIMRNMPTGSAVVSERWLHKRKELKELLKSVIEDGIEAGLFEDSHPELSARYIPGLVRAALIHGMDDMEPELLTAHITGFVMSALTLKGVSI
jgi:AcrR family transcriptional regulator